MGVTGLWKLIEPCGKPVPVETLEGKVLAVDISIWLHQAVKGFQDNKGSALPNAHLLGLFNRLCKLLYYRVKPVFIFDGSVPQLKRDTIARRQQQRSKLNTEAERIQALLLQSLAKEKVVQQALGINAELLLKSPTKRAIGKVDQVDDMFKLPELPAASCSSASKKADDDENDGSFTSLNSTDDYTGTSADDSSSFDESNPQHSYNANLQAIDVKSQHFRNLPADVRHEILVDIKETRKQSSWGRLHELPSRGDDFSVFQMKRLLKRRAVQESLEEAQQEMGGRTLTYAELNSLFTEEGIIEETALEKGTKQICSDEHTRFLLVRDLKKKITKTVESPNVEVKKQDSGIELKEESLSQPSKTIDEQEEEREKLGKEFDTELELALAMSLEGTQVYSQTDYCYESNEQLKLNRDQRKRLQNAAVGPARSYMIEYGGMNEEEVENIMEKTQAGGDQLGQKFASLVEDQNMDTTEPTDHSQSEEIHLHVSEDSETDSDFEEVADDCENIDTQEEKADVLKPKENDAMEIVVNPAQQLSQEDDIFADIFIPETESQPFEASEKGINNEVIVLQSQESVASKNLNENVITIPDSEELPTLEERAVAACEPNEMEKAALNVKPSSQSILSSLKSQLDDVKNINLDDIKVDAITIESSDEETHKDMDIVSKTPVKAEVVEICDSDDALPKPELSLKSPKSNTPNKNRSILEYFPADYVVKRTPDKQEQEDNEGVAKVKSPFFVKKTPKSSGKRSASKSDSASSTPSKVSKASKSLFSNFEENKDDGGDSLGVEPMKSTPATNEELLNEAAQLLKGQRTEDELKNMATDLAKERRDLETERNRQDRMGMSINQRMSSECQELLRLFGVPYIVAPMEAEAQCAFLDSIELTNGTITDDSDIWLFGGRTVYKNFFAQNKHVLEFCAEKIENSFNCDRKKLIQLACLVGSDYTTGINGIGAVTALEILASFTPSSTAVSQMQTAGNENMRELINAVLTTLNKFRDWWSAHRSSAAPIGTSARLALFKKLKNIELQEGFPSLAVVEAYLTPKVDENREAFSWGTPDVESIREYAKKTFGWTALKTNEILNPVLKRLNEKKSQATIRNYFAIKSSISGAQIKVSKRVQKAIDRMSGKVEDDTPEKTKSNGAAKKRAVRGKKKQATEKGKNEDANMEKAEVDGQNVIAEVQEEEQPSTSQQTARPTRKRAAIDLHSKKSDIIPQREKDKAKMLDNKAKAAEILKQTQKETAAKKKRKS